MTDIEIKLQKHVRNDFYYYYNYNYLFTLTQQLQSTLTPLTASVRPDTAAPAVYSKKKKKNVDDEMWEDGIV